MFTCYLAQKDTFPGLIYLYVSKQVYRHRENNFSMALLKGAANI